jgi:hypothetical protein
VTQNFSLIYQVRDSGSGQILQPRQLNLSPVPIAPVPIAIGTEWQKLRHGGLPAGTIFRLKYRDSHRRTAPPTLTAHTNGPLCVILWLVVKNEKSWTIKLY